MSIAESTEPGIATASPPGLNDAQDQKVSTKTKLAWGAGGFLENVMGNGIVGNALPIYNIGLGVNPVWLGLAMSIPRLLDAIVDPLIGNISDNTRTQWGRRRPLIFLSSILCAILFAAVWLPPLGISKLGLLVFFLTVSILYYLSLGIFSISYNALGFELSNDYHERTRIQSWRLFFISVSSVLMGYMYKLALFFGTDEPGLRREVVGIRTVGILIGLLILVAGLAPAIFCRERIQNQQQPKISLGKSIRLTFTNPVFLVFALIPLTTFFGQAMVAPFSLYINIYHVCAGNKNFAADLQGQAGIANLVANIAMVPVVSWVAGRIGKRLALFIGQGLVIASFAGSWFLFNPQWPYLTILHSVLCSMGITFFLILYGSMLADICDLDELKSGLRREGMYGAVSAFVTKLGMSSVTVVSGYILIWVGYDAEVTPSAKVIDSLRTMYAWVPAVFVAVGMVANLMLPLSEKKAREVRAQIQARKQAAEGHCEPIPKNWTDQ